MKQAKKGSKTPFYVAIGVITLLGVGAIAYVARTGDAAVATLDPNLPPVKPVGYVMGSPQAPVEIIEFADFECPGCGQWALLTKPDVVSRLVNTGRARLRVMDFPVTSGHVNSLTASLAAGCANDQGKFWEMHDLIFQTQDKWSTPYTKNPRKEMDALATQLGLDRAAFDACMDSKKYQAHVKANAEEAARVGVQSTPSFVIAGKVYAGARYDVIKKAVDEATAATGAPADSARR